jgi:hypothetical protein
MSYDVLYNFISPVTGRVLSDTNYVLYGDRRGIAQPSPIITDIRLDLINLRVDFDVASSASYIIGFPNSRLPNAQVLHSLSDGLLFNTSGIISTIPIIPIGFLPDLPMGNIWIGNGMNRPIPNPTISTDNLPDLSFGHMWIGNLMNRPIEQEVDFISGPIPAASVNDNVVVWDGFSGRLIKDSLIPIAQLVGEALAAAEAAAVAEAAAKEALIAAGIATAAAAFILGFNGFGKKGSKGAAGTTGLAGAPGAASSAGKDNIIIDANVNFVGGRLENIAPSPEADYDAVNAKWCWDLLNDNVEIIWEQR